MHLRRATRPLRHAVAHALARVVRFAARRSTRGIALRAGAMAGECLPRVFRASARRSILQIDHATGGRLASKDVRACATLVGRRLGENLADVLHGEWPRIAIDGRPHLDAALDGGRGAVIASAHHGPWELIPVALARAGYRVGLLTRPMRDPVWDDMLRELREDAGIRVFPRGTSLQEVVRWTSHGGVLGIAFDQRVRGARSAATFVGLPAPAVRGPVVLAERARAALLACTVRRTGEQALMATISPPIAAVPGHRDRTTRVLARHLDVLVRRDLAQWVWWHDRFSLPSSRDAASLAR